MPYSTYSCTDAADRTPTPRGCDIKLRVHAFATLALATVLLGPPDALGKARATRVADVLPTLKTGQWIRLEGVLMKDRTVLCKELKVLAGDFLDDDWCLTGRIEEVDVRGRQLKVGNLMIDVGEDAELEGPYGHLKSLAEFKRGMIVEIDGSYLKDRTFVAKEVADESDEFTMPSGERHLRIVGKIEQVDPGRRRIQTMGTVFVLTDKTQVKSVIR